MLRVYSFTVSCRNAEISGMMINHSSILDFKNKEELIDSFRGSSVQVLENISLDIENMSIAVRLNQFTICVLLIVSNPAIDKFNTLFGKYYSNIYPLVFSVAEKVISDGCDIKISEDRSIPVYMESLKKSVDSIVKHFNSHDSWFRGNVISDVDSFKSCLNSESNQTNDNDGYKWCKGTIPQPMFSNNDGSHRFGEYNIPSVAPHLIKISESNNSKAVKVFKFNTDCVDEFEASINQYISSRKVVSINTEVVSNIIIVIVLTEEEQNENRSRNTLY